jgi:hypothetical protein
MEVEAGKPKRWLADYRVQSELVLSSKNENLT